MAGETASRTVDQLDPIALLDPDQLVMVTVAGGASYKASMGQLTDWFSRATGGVNAFFPNGAETAVPQGITGRGAITGGAGGTNGTFTAVLTGGNFAANPTVEITVAGGALTAVTVKHPGEYIGAAPVAPTINFGATSAGLAGAACALTIGHLVAPGARYFARTADGKKHRQWRNNGGAPQLVDPEISIIGPALATDLVFAADVAGLFETYPTYARQTALIGGANTGAGRYIMAAPLPVARKFRHVEWRAGSATGTVKLQSGTFNAATREFVPLQEVSFAVTVPNAVNSADIVFDAPAGHAVAYYIAVAGVGVYSPNAAEEGGWSFTASASGPATGGAVYTGPARFEFSLHEQRVAASAAAFLDLRADVDALQTQMATATAATTRTQRVVHGWPAMKPGQTPDPANGVWGVDSPAPFAGTVTSISAYGRADGALSVAYYEVTPTQLIPRTVPVVLAGKAGKRVYRAGADFAAFTVQAGWIPVFTGLLPYLTKGSAAGNEPYGPASYYLGTAFNVTAAKPGLAAVTWPFAAEIEYQAPVKPATLPGFAAAGDSLTRPVDAPGDGWPEKLAALIGRDVFNGGRDGKDSLDISTWWLASDGLFDRFLIDFSGFNDADKSEAGTATLIARCQAMQASLRNPALYLRLSILTGSTAPAGSAAYVQAMARNAALQAAFPANYFDIRAPFVKYGLLLAGLPVTPDDQADIDQDVIPRSLRKPGDYVHPNAAGRLALTMLVRGELARRGQIS